MPTTYVLATDDILALLRRTMRRHHPRLDAAEVKVGVLFARNPDGPALKRNGYGVLAMIKPVPLKDRLTKGYDAELAIDERDYEELRPAQRLAMFDHELRHIDTIDRSTKELREEPDGPVHRTDDLGRPKLRSVPGNWQAGDGFTDVVARNGADAIEYEILRRSWTHCERAAVAGAGGELDIAEGSES